jgi:UDP-N-acetylmuramoylalanine--D-glutamate ligase
MRLDRVAGKKVGIVGAARSGVAAARLLRRHGASVFVSDSRSEDQLADALKTLRSENIEFETSGNTARAFEGRDFVVVSPGVPPDAPVSKQIDAAGVPVISEIELGFWLCDGNMVAITGSNGKTTTTTVTGEIFKQSGVPTFVAGNIGSPFCDICDQVPAHGWVVLEISSAQLERCYDFKPRIASVLNLTPDHLDRYGDFATYAEMKMRIGENQTATDAFVANRDDAYLMELCSPLPGKKFYFSISDIVAPGVCVENGMLTSNVEGDARVIMPVTDITLPGPHNLQNCAAAAAIAAIAGVSDDSIRAVLSTFAGVEHRLEGCGAVGHVKFINDSKATNVDSVWYALQSVAGKLVVIMGGRDKKGDFGRLRDLVSRHVSEIVLIGEASDKIERSLGDLVPTHKVDSMEKAVRIGFELARPEGTVMLSPACASFDMFNDYEHRGRVFKQAVSKLREEAP